MWPKAGFMRVLLMLFSVFAGCMAHAASFQISSKAFQNLNAVPEKYTCDGQNTSPAIEWSGAPAGTRSYVIIFYNPDAPFGTYYNWTLYNVPPTIQNLPEGADRNLPESILVGATSSGDYIYRGPCPPNAAIHHYIFKAYALDVAPDFPERMSAEDILKNIKGHILAEAEWIGTYHH